LSWRGLPRARVRRAALGVLALLGALALLVVGLTGAPASSHAAPAGGGGEPTPQTDDSVPATKVTMLGSSTKETTDETWGLGERDGVTTLVRYTPETGWTLGPALLSAAGQAVSGFKLDQPEGGVYDYPSPLAGQIAPDGAGVLAGTVPVPHSGIADVVLVREPGEAGGAFREVPAPEGAAALGEGETLFGVDRAPMIAALAEGAGGAGALVVPVDEAKGGEDRVLHWSGKIRSWSSEPIEIPAGAEELEPLAISASTPSNAWLLAKVSAGGSIALFRRDVEAGEAATWKPVALKPAGEPGEALTVATVEPPTAVKGEQPFTVPAREQSQLLTAVGGEGGGPEGVWIDGQRTDVGVSTTMFYKQEGSSYLTSWCRLPEGSPASTPACENELPEELPAAGVRSFAWEGSGGFGERVITGFPDGVSLRLEGTEFKRVLALGGSPGAAGVGGAYGSAFSTPKEGWLGQQRLPVHLTLDPLESKLSPWPVSFRRALLALAPAPDEPVGSLSSEAVAVGDRGEVARYKPGEGWLPESLLSPGGRRETPRLRAVAWPTPARVYAVGDLGEMWLWRGETGLWEKDPATPMNFRGNLLGIAFKPEEASRGYAVGEGGVLLRYGKTWAQEPTCGPEVSQPCLPAALAQANFTSIAFSGSEAIVVYRKLVAGGADEYEGGLLVNEGSGWSIDAGAAALIGQGAPGAVAGLPDGAAAFATDAGQVYERESAGAPWQATPTPYPGTSSPGSLALFREDGALRVIASGVVPDTFELERESAPPPGFPPTLLRPYPIGNSQEVGVLRQTATGWSDEQHELNDVKEPPGQYVTYDTAYQPDPVESVLVSPSGAQGWSVGGIVNNENEQMDTADVWRYPAEAGSAPPGVGEAPISSASSATTIAFGGGAQCAAPCADSANAHVGPDMWLKNALNEAKTSGAQAFFYTGPRVTKGETSGKAATLALPLERELERYRQLLSESPLPTYFAASPWERANLGNGNEAMLASVFKGFPPGLFAGSPACSPSAVECQAAYYGVTLKGPASVRVLVLDDSSPVDPTQLQWLAQELAAVAGREAAIVVGNADLHAAMTEPDNEAWATAVVNTLIEGHASAYFYDSPEQNTQLPLQVGGGSVKSFGSGTLGYVLASNQAQQDFIGASGFLLAEVGPLNPETGVFEVGAKLIPNVGELALEAEGGTLLRRSQAALFDGLARRPRSGNLAQSGSTTPETDPYTTLPDECIGVACAGGILPAYQFTSSNKEVGQFVKRNIASLDQEAVLPGPKGEPIPDEEASGPGLFCAYNKGETIVTISAGGKSASLPVTVEAGSVRQPCGTVHVNATTATANQAVAAPAPAPAPASAAPAPASAPPPVPPPPPALPVARPPAARPYQPDFFVQPAPVAFLPAFVPVPVPTPARPTPPSGTSAVTSPVEAPQREEEDEAAPESVSNEAVAYRAPEHEPSPVYLLGIVVLAAFAGVSVRRRPGRGRRDVRIAPATISTMRSQRRISGRRDDWR
jgi:hypothetical protein